MPVETTRTQSKVQVSDPGGSGAIVEIPCTERISFRDQKTRGQGYRYKMNNADKAGRKVHTHTVQDANDPDRGLDVERIDEWRVRDHKSYSWKWKYRPKNEDPPPEGPPSHWKKHTVTYTSEQDNRFTITVEVIDEFRVRDQKAYGQMVKFKLKNSPGEGGSGPDYDHPDMESLEPCAYNGIPVRLDPFRNIIGVSLPPKDQGGTPSPPPGPAKTQLRWGRLISGVIFDFSGAGPSCYQKRHEDWANNLATNDPNTPWIYFGVVGLAQTVFIFTDPWTGPLPWGNPKYIPYWGWDVWYVPTLNGSVELAKQYPNLDWNVYLDPGPRPPLNTQPTYSGSGMPSWWPQTNPTYPYL